MGGVHGVGLDKRVMNWIPHNVIQSIVAALGVLCPVQSSVCPQSLATTELFAVRMVFSSPGCYVVGVTRDVTFSDGFFHVVTGILKSSMSFLGVAAHSFLELNSCTIVYPLIR